jgi:hypothetical protein
MKNFTSPSFFRLFDLLMSTHNPGFRRSKWTLDGVDCGRERHSFTGQQYGSPWKFSRSAASPNRVFCLPASPRGALMSDCLKMECGRGDWHSEVVQCDEGLRVHPTGWRRRQRCVCTYLGGRESRPQRTPRGRKSQLRHHQRPWQRICGKSAGEVRAPRRSRRLISNRRTRRALRQRQ